MKPLVEFIIPTYNRYKLLKCTVSSIVAQNVINWKCTVVVDGMEDSNILQILKEFDDERIDFLFTGTRYNDWGHTPREIGKQQANSHYVIMTGDDNYYTPNFVKELGIAAIGSPGMVYWDMVHSHYNYQYFKCSPSYNQIDMGAFATRTDLAKQIKLGVDFAADGTYVENFKKKFPNEKIVKINKVLFVHN